MFRHHLQHLDVARSPRRGAVAAVSAIVVAMATLGGLASSASAAPGVPAAPTFIAPAQGATVTTGTPMFVGMGQPGAAIMLTYSVATSCTPGQPCPAVPVVQLCSVQVQDSGLWSCTSMSITLPVGTVTVQAFQSTAPDVSSPSTSLTLTVTNSGGVAPTVPSAPVTTAPSVPVTTAPSAPDTAAPSAPVFTAPAPGSTVTTTMPRYAGTGEPGASVRVYTQTSPACAPGKMCSMLIRQLDLCSATVQRNGTWSCTSTQALSTGSAVVFAIQTDAAQNSSAPATDMFTVATRQAYCPVTNPFGPGWRRAPGC